MHVLEARAVDQQPQPVALEDSIALALLVEGQLVLEARAAAPTDPDAQSRKGHVGTLGVEELAHLLGSLVGELNHCYPKCSEPTAPAILGPEMPTPEEIKQRIEAAIPGARVEVEDYTGGGDHFRATVTAEAFAGRSRIDQHRLVYDVFGAEIGGPIHALSLKTAVA